MAYNASPNENEDKNMVSTNPVVPPPGSGGEAIGASSAGGAQQPGQQSYQNPNVQTQQQTVQSNAATGIQSKPAASGGFTNLQSYMNQNKNSGTQLSNRIGTGVNRQVDTSVNQANRALTSTEQANQNAKNDINQGQNYLSQISKTSSYNPTSAVAPDYLNPYLTKSSPTIVAAATPPPTQTFDVNSIANDPAAFAKYNALRTGTAQAADQAALTSNLTNAQTQQGLTNQLVGNLAGQLGSSANRGNLLSQYVNRNPQYSQSAQNLDTYFLQKDAGGIQNLQNQVKGTQNTTLKTLADKIGALQTGAGDISRAGTDVASNIQNKADENTQNLLNQLTGQIGNVNDQRSAEQKYAQDQWTKLQSGSPVDQRFADMMGIGQGQSLYNVVGSNALSGFANLSPAQATTFNDVANTKDVSQYAALAKLAGVDPSSYQLRAPSGLEAAVAARTSDQGSLKDALAAAQAGLAGTNITGHGVYDLPQFGGGFNAPVVADANLTGANAASLFDQYHVNDAASLAANQAALMNSAFGGLTPGDQGNADLIARRNALNSALSQLTNSGYFNRANIVNNTSTLK